jgi:hypothetical protein
VRLLPGLCCVPSLTRGASRTASDIAGLGYYERDFRRAYPQLHMVTQQDLTTLLLADTNEDGTKRCVCAAGQRA